MTMTKDVSSLLFACALHGGPAAEAVVREHVEKAAPGFGGSKDELMRIARARRAALADLAADGALGSCEEAELQHLNGWLARNGRPKVDVARLVEEIKKTEAEHRAWKKAWRAARAEMSRTRDWKAHVAAMKAAPGQDWSWKLRDLYAFRAWLRGRLHARRERMQDGTVSLRSFEAQERRILELDMCGDYALRA